MGKSRNVTTTERIDPQAERFRNQAFDRANSASNAIATGSDFTGQRVADPSAGLQESYGMSRNMMGLMPGAVNAFQGQLGGIDAASNVFGQAAGGFGQSMNQFADQSRFANMGMGMLGGQFGQNNPFANAGAMAPGAMDRGLAGLDAAGAGAGVGMDALGRQAGGTGAGIDALRGALTPGSTMDGMSRFQNPFQEQVIDRVNADFGRQAEMTSMGIRSDATRAGAFGGSRAALTEGAALGALGRGQADTIAGIRSAGFTDAANRAAADSASRIGVANNLASYGGMAGNQLSNLGLSAAGQNVGAGFSGATFGADQFNRGQDRDTNIANTFVNQGTRANESRANFGFEGASNLGNFGQNALNRLSNFGMQGIGDAANFGNQMSGFEQAGFDANREAFGERDARIRNSTNMMIPFLNAQTGRTSTTPQQRNVAAGILGGATSGKALMKGPWGMLAGGILGGLG